MARQETIRIFRSLTAGAIPASLTAGELAANLVDGKLFIGGTNGSLIVFGNQSSGVTSVNGLVGGVTLTGDGGAVVGRDNGFFTAKIAASGHSGVASFDYDFFNVGVTGHVQIKTGIKTNNLIVLGTSTIFNLPGDLTGALPALDGSLLLEVNAKTLQGKTPRQVTDGGYFT